MKIDLRTRYLGLDLPNPIVVSACPLCEDLDALRRMEASGAAAVVMPSLFEEQVVFEELQVHGLYEFGTESFAESLSYFPPLDQYPVGPSQYLERLKEAKRAISIPVIASLNGTTTGGWLQYAALLEEAGADALELNLYVVATEPTVQAASVEARCVEVVAEMREHVSIPIAVKVTPFFTSFGNVAVRLMKAGADGLVLFNRFVHPDVDLETLSLRPDLVLSRPHDARLPLTWIGLLREHVEGSLAATSGVHTAEDVVKLLLVGADVVMTSSALYINGIDHIGALLDGTRRWLIEHEYESVTEMRGSLSHANCEDPSAYTRAGYMRTLRSFSTPEA
jgi:dihydroorotate dehydrogenase (fumarate)